MNPTNPLVNAMFTDLYQITMVYAHWKNKRHKDPAVFELFFRKHPFQGEYTIFAGLDECLKYTQTFKFAEEDIEYLQTKVPALSHCDAGFFDYLRELDGSELQIYALKEGSLAFPKVPLASIVGPLGIAQLIETAFLNLINFPSLVATNACRMVVAARSRGGSYDSKQKPILAEFGLRRAQGPDGGMTATKYSVLGGFDATSNVLAGQLFSVPIIGTNAHAYVQAYHSLEEVQHLQLSTNSNCGPSPNLNVPFQHINILSQVSKYRRQLSNEDPLFASTNNGELASFISYAVAFPDSFACIVDTYDTIQSGLRNFILVSFVLDDLGYIPKGIRLDSGDLASLSFQASTLCSKLFQQYKNRTFLNQLSIIASNDLNETALHELNTKPHSINIYGIGTNLVTCQEQPALGCVYKLVQLNHIPRMKLSNEMEKILIPGYKIPYRLYDKHDRPIIDLLTCEKDADENALPTKGKRILCRHPFQSQQRIYVTPSRVDKLHHLVFDKKNGLIIPPMDLLQTRQVSYSCFYSC